MLKNTNKIIKKQRKRMMRPIKRQQYSNVSMLKTQRIKTSKLN